MGFTEIEFRRADEIADVFNEKHRAVGRIEFRERRENLLSFQVATPTGVDLNGMGARSLNAAGIVVGCQIPFDDG